MLTYISRIFCPLYTVVFGLRNDADAAAWKIRLHRIDKQSLSPPPPSTAEITALKVCCCGNNGGLLECERCVISYRHRDRRQQETRRCTHNELE